MTADRSAALDRPTGDGTLPDTMAFDGETLTTVVTVGVLGLVGVRLVGGLRFATRGSGRSLVVEVVHGIRWRHLWPVPFVLAGVLVLATALIQLPVLEWGWWSALGGEGNPVTGSTTQTSGTVWEWLVPLVFVSMLLPALPAFAYAEERMFRTGAERQDGIHRIWSCVKFGLIHALIGIPIGVALALSVGGAYFLVVYLRAFRTTRSPREATLESTRAHTAYNGVIIGVVLLVVALDVLGGW